MLGLSEMMRRALRLGPGPREDLRKPGGIGDGFPEAVRHLKALILGKGEYGRLREDCRKGSNMI